jgi:hypothetical protein
MVLWRDSAIFCAKVMISAIEKRNFAIKLQIMRFLADAILRRAEN